MLLRVQTEPGHLQRPIHQVAVIAHSLDLWAAKWLVPVPIVKFLITNLRTIEFHIKVIVFVHGRPCQIDLSHTFWGHFLLLIVGHLTLKPIIDRRYRNLPLVIGRFRKHYAHPPPQMAHLLTSKLPMRVVQRRQALLVQCLQALLIYQVRRLDVVAGLRHGGLTILGALVRDVELALVRRVLGVVQVVAGCWRQVAAVGRLVVLPDLNRLLDRYLVSCIRLGYFMG